MREQFYVLNINNLNLFQLHIAGFGRGRTRGRLPLQVESWTDGEQLRIERGQDGRTSGTDLNHGRNPGSRI